MFGTLFGSGAFSGSCCFFSFYFLFAPLALISSSFCFTADSDSRDFVFSGCFSGFSSGSESFSELFIFSAVFRFFS